MKTLPLLLATVAMALFTNLAQAQTTAKEALTEAQTAYMRGDIATAKERFQFALKLDPDNLVAKNYLRSIEVEEAKNGKGSDLERQLKVLIMPHIEFKEATLSSALDYLKQQAVKVSGGKTQVSFVIPKELEDTKVTLSLSNIPFTEVLKYLSELTGYKISIDKYAVTIKQAAPEPAVAPAAAVDATLNNVIPNPVSTTTTVSGMLK